MAPILLKRKSQSAGPDRISGESVEQSTPWPDGGDYTFLQPSPRGLNKRVADDWRGSTDARALGRAVVYPARCVASCGRRGARHRGRIPLRSSRRRPARPHQRLPRPSPRNCRSHARARRRRRRNLPSTPPSVPSSKGALPMSRRWRQNRARRLAADRPGPRRRRARPAAGGARTPRGRGRPGAHRRRGARARVRAPRHGPPRRGRHAMAGHRRRPRRRADAAVRLSRGPGARRARPAAPRQRRVPGGGLRRAERSPHRHRLGRAVPREAQREGSRRVVPDGAAGRSALGAGAGRLAAALADDNPAAPRQPRQGARDQPVVGRRAPVPRRAGARRRRIDDAAQALDKALAVNPVQPRGALAARGDRVRSRTHRRTSRQLAQRVADARPRYGEVYRIAGAARRATTASTRRSRSRARRWRSIRPIRARWPTSACTCCAPATSRRARTALERVVQGRSVRRRHLQPAADARHARQVRHRPRRRL